MFFYRNPLKWVQKQKLFANDPDGSPEGDFFGTDLTNVVLAGSTKKVFVGALFDEGPAGETTAGSVYVFEEIEDRFTQTDKISAPNSYPDLNNFYFLPLAATNDGNRMLADGGGDDGRVYVYESGSNGYEILQELSLLHGASVGSGTTRKAFFVNGDEKIIIPAQYEDINGTNSGQVHIFQTSSVGYQQIQLITASYDVDGSPETSPESDWFGRDISINSGATILAVAAPGDEEAYPSGRGAVYIFESSSVGYQQVQKIITNWGASDNILTNICLNSNGDRLAISEVEGTSLATGSVFIFERSGTEYQQIQRITPSFDTNGEPEVDTEGEQFGRSILLNAAGNILFVGSANNNEKGGTSDFFSGAGAVYIFEDKGTGFQQIRKITPDTNSEPAGDNFGWSIALDPEESTLLIGSPFDEENGGSGAPLTGAGAVYVFKYTRDY